MTDQAEMECRTCGSAVWADPYQMDWARCGICGTVLDFSHLSPSPRGEDPNVTDRLTRSRRPRKGDER